MSGKRVLAVYTALLLGFAVVLCRLYLLALHPAYAARAAAQILRCAGAAAHRS